MQGRAFGLLQLGEASGDLGALFFNGREDHRPVIGADRIGDVIEIIGGLQREA